MQHDSLVAMATGRHSEVERLMLFGNLWCVFLHRKFFTIPTGPRAHTGESSMPLHVTDFTWTQTDSAVHVCVPLKGAKTGSVDVVSTDEYLKVGQVLCNLQHPGIFSLIITQGLVLLEGVHIARRRSRCTWNVTWLACVGQDELWRPSWIRVHPVLIAAFHGLNRSLFSMKS